MLLNWPLVSPACILKSHEETRQHVLEQRKSAEEEYDKLIVYLAAGGLVLTVGFVRGNRENQSLCLSGGPLASRRSIS
jgi:hypothetical protein